MTTTELMNFFGWMSVINICLLGLYLIFVVVFKGFIMKIHKGLFNLPEAELNRIYFSYLARYKTLTLMFCIVPYFALWLMN